ncbi:hypothetical protein [Roseibium marinum]|uniref:Uncharacterized protein n=1 Tax=Roseibium marinum TaxID=281252 RepID=A0A2S3UVJ2_9HYPH|nr:hypothetical protein [Roseibium marinum]POF31737.1 hypothetical protein CLV41_104307 [Roseibium marinum]
MKINNTYSIALIVSGGILLASTMTSMAGPSNGSNLRECYNNWISWCNEHTAGFPNSCYGESMDRCDGIHKASVSGLTGLKVNSMKSTALRKAKRANTPLVAPTVQPVRRAN